MSSPKELEAVTGISHVEQIPGLSEKVIAHVGEGDEETNRYIGNPIEIDPATNKRLFWKINRRILVIQLITYFCQSLDKGTLNFASIMGIKTDAKLVGQEVSISSSVLYKAFLPFESKHPVF